MAVLPWEWQDRFSGEMGLSGYDAALLAEEKDLAQFFSEITALTPHIKAAANWMIGPVRSLLNERKCSLSELGIKPSQIARLVEMTQNGTVNLNVAQQQILPILLSGVKDDPYEIAVEHQWLKESDTEKIRSALLEILARFPDKAEDYRKGKKNLAGLFMGELMKKTGGKADPKVAMEILNAIVSEKKEER